MIYIACECNSCMYRHGLCVLLLKNNIDNNKIQWHEEYNSLYLFLFESLLKANGVIVLFVSENQHGQRI